ncbi:MAG TPA: hypothetical protein VLH39_03000 [Magnetospirillaceae bacterium]|nr:hypothetical protein [Magnetospirillaceae bacterium]
MIALIVGIVLIILAALASAPFGLDWWQDVVKFLRGSLPVLAALIGLVAIFIGIADIKDRREAMKEEEQEAREAKGAAPAPKKD